MQIRWRLRMAAAQREVWTAAQLRRLLAQRWTAPVVGIGLGTVRQATCPGEAGNTRRVVHCVGVHAQRPVRGRHHTRWRRWHAGKNQPRTQGRPRPLDAAAVTNYPACVDCAAPVKFRHRNRCHACQRRVDRAAAKRPCPRCGQLRHLQPSGTCAACVRAAAPRKPPKTITCVRCGEQRRNAGHGLCNRCTLADPDRAFRYAASMAGRMGTVPAWWHELTAFAAARYHPGGAMTILRKPPGSSPRSRP